jgi:hypothetical protein
MRSDRFHKVVYTKSSQHLGPAVVHNEPVDENSLTQLLSYLTAGLLWTFAGVVACMTVVPI